MSKLDEEAITAFVVSDTYVPPNLRPGLIAYIEEGRPTGDFLKALLSDKLFETVGRADPVTGEYLSTIVRWIFNHAPAPCWGSPEKYATWTGPFRSVEIPNITVKVKGITNERS